MLFHRHWNSICFVAVSAVYNCRFFLQVLLLAQLRTLDGGKRLTRSFSHGLAQLVHQWSWIPLVAKISLWSLALSLELCWLLIRINWFTLVMGYVSINDSFVWDETLAVQLMFGCFTMWMLSCVNKMLLKQSWIDWHILLYWNSFSSFLTLAWMGSNA